jgi:hypothetical protein
MPKFAHHTRLKQHSYFLVVDDAQVVDGTKVSYTIYLSKLRPILYILSAKCRYTLTVPPNLGSDYDTNLAR